MSHESISLPASRSIEMSVLPPCRTVRKSCLAMLWVEISPKQPRQFGVNLSPLSYQNSLFKNNPLHFMGGARSVFVRLAGARPPTK